MEKIMQYKVNLRCAASPAEIYFTCLNSFFSFIYINLGEFCFIDASFSAEYDAVACKL